MSSAEVFDGADELRRAWLAGLAPDPALSVAQWADRHRILSSRAASEAGPYRTARTPYMRAIMDALSAHDPARKVVFIKAAQVGAAAGSRRRHKAGAEPAERRGAGQGARQRRGGVPAARAGPDQLLN